MSGMYFFLAYIYQHKSLHGMLGLKFLGHFSWTLQALLRFHMVDPIQGSEGTISLFLHIYLFTTETGVSSGGKCCR